MSDPMRDLEARLLDLGAHIDYPATPALATAVRRHIAAASVESRAPSPLWWRWRRRVTIAVLVAVAVPALVLGISPVRTTVAHWLGIRGVEIVPVQTLPPISTRTPGAVETPAVPGDLLQLGIPLTLAQAQQRAGFTPLVPAGLGAPDAVWVRDDDGGVVTLVYLPRPGLPAVQGSGVGLLVTELRASTDTQLFRKFVDPQTPVLPVTVGGVQGYWIGGAPHGIGYILPGGAGVVDMLRLAGPTLLLQHGALSLRIEGIGDEAQALAVARSLR